MKELKKMKDNTMIYLENTELKIVISEKGAELQNVYNKETQLEYLWEGDPAFWGKKSPVLFPIVGTLKNNQFTHNGERDWHNIWLAFAAYSLIIAIAFAILFKHKHNPNDVANVSH